MHLPPHPYVCYIYAIPLKSRKIVVNWGLKGCLGFAYCREIMYPNGKYMKKRKGKDIVSIVNLYIIFYRVRLWTLPRGTITIVHMDI
jgi:hypothetical protein